MSRRAVIVGALALAAVVVAIAVLLLVRGGEEQRAGVSTRARAIALGPDGAGFAAVERLDDGRWRSGVLRVGAGGGLDDEFVEVGIHNPVAIALDRDGSALVAGDRVAGGRRVLAVARVARDGKPDARFGRGGVATVPAGGGDAVARGVAVGAGGAVVVAGDATRSKGPALAVARLDRAGGAPHVDLIDGATAGGAAAGRDGGVLVAGTDADDGALLARVPADGGAPKVSRARTRLTSARWTAVAPLADGGAVAIGSARGRDVRSVVTLQRFDRDGRATTGSGTPAGDGDAYAAGAAVGGSGTIVVAANGVHGDGPAAFTFVLGSNAPPRQRGAGLAAGIAPTGALLTTRWDGVRQRAAFVH